MQTVSIDVTSSAVGGGLALSSVVKVRVCVCSWGRYFPSSSTKEMLEEWRPLLCVFDAVMQKAISNMELFLPTIMPPEEHSLGFR